MPKPNAQVRIIKTNSTIIPQCISAYKNNIAGFGIGVKYKDDIEETSETKAEWDKMTEIIKYLNMDTTSQVAREITEEQVFQPERQPLAWAVNNKLLADYHFKYVEAYFKAPVITTSEDITKVLNVVERAGGLTPNKAKEITLQLYGETSDDYEGEWGDIPLAYSKSC